nr:chondroitin proteoglycan-2-like [Onthophagus taurus]
MKIQTFYIFFILITLNYASDIKCPPNETLQPTFFKYSDCSTCFYVCSNWTPIKMVCGGNLVFNPQLFVCDYPRNIKGCYNNTITSNC